MNATRRMTHAIVYHEFDLAGYLPGVEIVAILRVTIGEQP